MSVAFDTAAAAYDATFTDRPLARRLREAVWEQLAAAFRPGDRVLELGCGTGEDAVWLAGRGVHVTATDASPRMLEMARRKAEAAGVADRIGFELLDFGADLPMHVSRGERGGRRGFAAFDGAFSNFGALNCLADRRPLARALADRVRPGGALVLVVMGPFCPWEIGWHLLRLAPGTALRRFRRGAEARVGDPPAPVRVWYPTPRRLRRELGPWFRHRRTVGLGVVLPPPYLARLVEGRPGVLSRLGVWDRRLGRRFPGTWLNDHYVLRLERR